MPTFELKTLGATHRALFDSGIAVLDSNYGPPLLWGTPKLSCWYAVALLARDGSGDRDRASKLLLNSLTQQDLDKNFPQNYGSFKNNAGRPYSSGQEPLWVSDIYDSYDPNNALFLAVAGIMIDALFPGHLDQQVHAKFMKAMHVAVRGNIPRSQGWHGDDLSPEYSNPFFMRAVCSAYYGNLFNDSELLELSDSWVKEASALWEKFDTPGEFNSPTYLGITLMALGLAQFCQPESEIYKTGPKLIESTWISLGETYNPTLQNVAGPWDRGYGYCMTQYYACIGSAIAAVVGDVDCAMPSPLNGAPHYSDVAIVPMQMILADYVEAHLPQGTRARLLNFEEHLYRAKSTFSPFDKVPRDYSIYVGQGINIGGVTYDETQVAGPKGEITQFVPAVIQWDAGKNGGGCGWIAAWPTAKCAKIVASSRSLTFSLPPSVDGTANDTKRITLHIGSLPFMQLDKRDFQSDRQVLPGLTLSIGGNIAQSAKRTLRYDKSTRLHGASFYELTFELAKDSRETPELVLGLEKTSPPDYPLTW